MKTKLAIFLLALCMPSCASQQNPAFMLNSSASIMGGYIQTPEGPAILMGQHPEDRPHPFFGAP